MNRNRIAPLLLLAAVMAFIPPPRTWAASKEQAADKDKLPSLTVAILDFEATTPGSPDLGKQISEALAATLSGQDGFTLVDRAGMSRTLTENALNMTGLVDVDHATKIGKLVGAKILVAGRIFPLDKQLYFTVKVIGTETSRMSGVLLKGDKDGDMGDLMLKLADKVAARLRTEGPNLVAAAGVIEDPIPGLKKALANRKLPKIALKIEERHITLAPVARIDPAVETEFRIVLQDAGFTVVQGDATELADAGVTVIVGGEAISEFADRIGNLINCAARVEIKVTDRKGVEVLFSDRETTRAVDLAETIASKTALEKAGRTLAIRLLRHFDDTLPVEKGKGDR
jgi:hypothetical protein